MHHARLFAGREGSAQALTWSSTETLLVHIALENTSYFSLILHALSMNPKLAQVFRDVGIIHGPHQYPVQIALGYLTRAISISTIFTYTLCSILKPSRRSAVATMDRNTDLLGRALGFKPRRSGMVSSSSLTPLHPLQPE